MAPVRQPRQRIDVGQVTELAVHRLHLRDRALVGQREGERLRTAATAGREGWRTARRPPVRAGPSRIEAERRTGRRGITPSIRATSRLSRYGARAKPSRRLHLHRRIDVDRTRRDAAAPASGRIDVRSPRPRGRRAGEGEQAEIDGRRGMAGRSKSRCGGAPLPEARRSAIAGSAARERAAGRPNRSSACSSQPAGQHSHLGPRPTSGIRGACSASRRTGRDAGRPAAGGVEQGVPDPKASRGAGAARRQRWRHFRAGGARRPGGPWRRSERSISLRFGSFLRPIPSFREPRAFRTIQPCSIPSGAPRPIACIRA